MKRKSVTLLLVEIFAVLLLLVVVSLILLHATPSTVVAMKPWQRAIGGAYVLHIIVGALIPLTLGVLFRVYQRSNRFQCAFLWCFRCAMAWTSLCNRLWRIGYLIGAIMVCRCSAG